MATQSGGLFQDQNLNVHYDGAPVGQKPNMSKAEKRGALGARKALIDISNSGKPSSLVDASKKHNVKNMISTGKAQSSKLSLGEKRNMSKAPEKVQTGGRKALSDLTNSGKPLVPAPKKIQGKKLHVLAEAEILPNTIAEEQFLHNHHECIKAQRRAMDTDHFLKTIGLDDDISMELSSPLVRPLGKLKLESPPRHLEMEMPELLVEEKSPWKTELYSGTPKSPLTFIQRKDNFSDFMLMETPHLLKR